MQGDRWSDNPLDVISYRQGFIVTLYVRLKVYALKLTHIIQGSSLLVYLLVRNTIDSLEVLI